MQYLFKKLFFIITSYWMEMYISKTGSKWLNNFLVSFYEIFESIRKTQNKIYWCRTYTKHNDDWINTPFIFYHDKILLLLPTEVSHIKLVMLPRSSSMTTLITCVYISNHIARALSRPIASTGCAIYQKTITGKQLR